MSMKPVPFPDQTDVYAKNQPEYLPLPVYKNAEGTVVSCWSMTWRDRLRILVTGKIWLWQMTFNHPLQPQKVQSENPFCS